jgi:hypothetical protein
MATKTQRYHLLNNITRDNSFVMSKQILDRIIISEESLHSMQEHKKRWYDTKN